MKKNRLDAVIVIRLPKWALEKLKRIASKKGLRPSTLARMWILEKLQSIKI